MLVDDCVEHHKVLPTPNSEHLKNKTTQGERSICCSTWNSGIYHTEIKECMSQLASWIPQKVGTSKWRWEVRADQQTCWFNFSNDHGDAIWKVNNAFNTVSWLGGYTAQLFEICALDLLLICRNRYLCCYKGWYLHVMCPISNKISPNLNLADGLCKQLNGLQEGRLLPCWSGNINCQEIHRFYTFAPQHLLLPRH